jgi:hypothetical protein
MGLIKFGLLCLVAVLIAIVSDRLGKATPIPPLVWGIAFSAFVVGVAYYLGFLR